MTKCTCLKQEVFLNNIIRTDGSTRQMGGEGCSSSKATSLKNGEAGDKTDAKGTGLCVYG